MAEFLDTDNQVIRQRLEIAMQQWERGAELAIYTLHERLDGLLAQGQQRFADIAMGFEGVNPLDRDPVEGFYAGLDGLRDDRAEDANTLALAQLHDRLNDMQQARQQERSHGQGMGYA